MMTSMNHRLRELFYSILVLLLTPGMLLARPIGLFGRSGRAHKQRRASFLHLICPAVRQMAFKGAKRRKPVSTTSAASSRLKPPEHTNRRGLSFHAGTSGKWPRFRSHRMATYSTLSGTDGDLLVWRRTLISSLIRQTDSPPPLRVASPEHFQDFHAQYITSVKSTGAGTSRGSIPIPIGNTVPNQVAAPPLSARATGA